MQLRASVEQLSFISVQAAPSLMDDLMYLGRVKHTDLHGARPVAFLIDFSAGKKTVDKTVSTQGPLTIFCVSSVRPCYAVFISSVRFAQLSWNMFQPPQS